MKTRMLGLPDSEKTLRICITVKAEYQCVTDEKTDGQTDEQTDILPRHSLCYAYASRGKNEGTNFNATWHKASPGSRA